MSLSAAVFRPIREFPFTEQDLSLIHVDPLSGYISFDDATLYREADVERARPAPRQWCLCDAYAHYDLTSCGRCQLPLCFSGLLSGVI
jgi:hypothetical protein